MCIEAPGRIVAIDAAGAVVELSGRRRRASTLLFPDARVGDWVTVAAGTIVDRLSAAEAAEIRSILDHARLPHDGRTDAQESGADRHAAGRTATAVDHTDGPAHQRSTR